MARIALSLAQLVQLIASGSYHERPCGDSSATGTFTILVILANYHLLTIIIIIFIDQLRIDEASFEPSGRDPLNAPLSVNLRCGNRHLGNLLKTVAEGCSSGCVSFVCIHHSHKAYL